MVIVLCIIVCNYVVYYTLSIDIQIQRSSNELFAQERSGGYIKRVPVIH